MSSQANLSAVPVSGGTSSKIVYPPAGALLSRVAGSARIIARSRELRSTTTFAAAVGAATATRGEASGTAFVFQGGGSLAASQVGMVRALADAGIKPDLVIGSSSGAMNAVALAAAPSGLDALEGLWRSLTRRRVAPLSMRQLLSAVTGRSEALLSNAGMRALVEQLLPARLEDCAIPAHVVVTDFDSGQPVVISTGDTVAALLASTAFPGLYPPVTAAGRRFIDGGVSADVPVLQAERLGAAVVYVLPAALSGDVGDRRMRGPIAFAYRALGQILDGAAQRDTQAARGPVHVLPAPSSAASNPLDFRGTGRLIDEGYARAASWLAARPSPLARSDAAAPPAGSLVHLAYNGVTGSPPAHI